jgi:hypothetical protein
VSAPPLAIPNRVLLDAQGRPIAAKPVAEPKPPERVTAVKFLRKLAEDAGGIRTPHGQAIHRAAGHMVKLHEELHRCAQLKDLSGEHTPERLDAAASGIYEIARQALIEKSGGERVPDAWDVVVRERPEEARMYIGMAIAALGGPVYTPPCTAEEAAEPDPLA